MDSTHSKTLDQLRGEDRTGAFENRALRKRTFMTGLLVHGDGAFTAPCTIRDISEGGAKIILDRRRPLPGDVYLIAVKYGVAYLAKVAWLNFPARGLQFTKAYPLGTDVPKELSFLRQLWLDLCSRSGGIPVVPQWDAEQIKALSGSSY
jgi:hypothetical protein